MPRWRNWSGSASAEPREILALSDEAGVRAAVRRAASEGLAVRVVGTGHSGPPLCATDGLLLSLDGLAGLAEVDRESGLVTVGAGTKLHDLTAALHDEGLAAANLGDVDVQALAGAIGTGTHGTGRELANLSSRVRGLRLVVADGSVLELGEADPRLPGARVSLGALGVVTSVRFAAVPAYRLYERIERVDCEVCLEELADSISAHRHFEFFWWPQKDRVDRKCIDPTDADPAPLPDRPWERIDWSHRILPSERTLQFFEMEYAVPAEAGPDCFRAVRERMRARHPDVAWPVEYRTVAPDDAWLSPAHGRDTVTISVHQDGRLPWREVFEDVEPVFWECGGRPHWGKLHSLRAPRLAPLYPEWERFLALRDELDPGGRFLNEHLRGLFLES